MKEYDERAEDFCEKTGTKIIIEYLKHDYHFQDDKEERDIYKVTIKRNKKQFSLNFGQSLINSDHGNTPPTEYGILAHITKYDPEDFENFCSEYGYDTDSKKAEKIYKAVEREYNNVYRLFSDVMEELQEIN